MRTPPWCDRGLSCVTRKTCLLGFRNRSDTNHAIKQWKLARGLKFLIEKVEGLNYVAKSRFSQAAAHIDQVRLKNVSYEV